MQQRHFRSEPGLEPLSKLPAVKKRSRAEAVEKIKIWFFENFEDPAQETPYDGSEGGYIYIHGGPYDTRDVIEENFGDLVSTATIELAIEAIEEEGGPDWAPAGNRVLPPEEDPFDEPENSMHMPTGALHERMLQKLESVEKVFADAWPSAAGIGHNRPPSNIEPIVLENDEFNELRRAVNILREQPAEPTGVGNNLVRAVKTLSQLSKRIFDYCAKHGNAFVDEAVKSAGHETGKWLIRGGALLAAANAAANWMHSLGISF